MIFFVSGRRVKEVIAAEAEPCNAPRICRQLERDRNDGFAVFAIRDGNFIADACGYWRRDGGRIVDAATATGMYDA